MKTSETTNELDSALAKAQGEMAGAVKSAKNPFFRSNYSDLASVMAAIRPSFAAHGLSFTQECDYTPGLVRVATRLAHESGQWILIQTCVPVVKDDPQGVGSAMTYAKRYAIQGLSAVPSVDDDGESAMQRATPAKAVSPAEVATLKKILGQLPGEVTANFLRASGCDNVEAVPADKFEWACRILRKKIADKGNPSA